MSGMTPAPQLTHEQRAEISRLAALAPKTILTDNLGQAWQIGRIREYKGLSMSPAREATVLQTIGSRERYLLTLDGGANNDMELIELLDAGPFTEVPQPHSTEGERERRAPRIHTGNASISAHCVRADGRSATVVIGLTDPGARPGPVLRLDENDEFEKLRGGIPRYASATIALPAREEFAYPLVLRIDHPDSGHLLAALLTEVADRLEEQYTDEDLNES